ncbi:unnamed protein product [Enterobius vermicularis]|uniref:WD_REPEATS_REGION domain-containing protein n=1 Tax=Enterobius vermicularis TaxID=51028 RepID=A0A0N4VMI2_ENTVE|nr:unnamed protein product [Enterobius vermicularis]
MFGTSGTFGNRPTGLFGSTPTTTQNQMNALEVPSPPDDTVQVLKFNPPITGRPFLLSSGSWDSVVRVWQVNENGQCEPKAQQTVGGPVLSLEWFEDGTKLFIGSADQKVYCWDLESNQVLVCGTVLLSMLFQMPTEAFWTSQVTDNGRMKKVFFFLKNKIAVFSTLSDVISFRFWDMRQLPTQTSLATIQLPERVYCGDMLYPMAVIGLANRRMKVYKLDSEPREVKDTETTLKFQSRCVAIFKDKNNVHPAGFGLGSIEGRVAIQYVEATNPKDNFTFKCHRSPELINGFQEIYAVNDICFHPKYGTLATAGSDGRISFWDKDSRTKLKTSDAMPHPITCISLHGSGQILAYAVGYDWSKGHEGNNPSQGAKIFLYPCDQELKPKPKK